MGDQARQVAGCQTMKSPECEKQDFVVNPVLDREPAKALEDLGDVFMFASFCSNAGCCILYTLQFDQQPIWDSIEKGISKIKAGCDVGMDQLLSSSCVQHVADLAYTPEMKVG